MYRKKRRSWTKHVDFMLLDVLCMQLAFVISYIIRFGTDNPYTDGDYRTLAIAFLFIDFFVEIVSDSFKNVLKRGYFDEFIATCRHVILVELIVTFYLFTTQTGSFYSRFSYYITVDEWELYEPHHRARMSFRPGLTGMWQVSGRSNITDFEEVVKLDTQYISEWSLRLDVKILWKTVWSVLKSDGAM